MKILDTMLDKRINCYSIMLSMDINKYLGIIEKAYENNGGIEGQRVPLTNKSAIRIRKTMRKDIKNGTVLPPVVIGCTTEKIKKIEKISLNNTEFNKIIEDVIENECSLSIIDGMQRTTALKEIKDESPEFNMRLRVELWITDNPNNLIYRMLVLNTGQISWSLKKQLEVVFSHVSKELKKSIPEIELIQSNDGGRSNKAKKYQVSHLVELYLGFSTRKCDINLGDKVSEEFAKQDIVEKSYNQQHLKYFIDILERLIKLDEIISLENGINKRLFGDQNARLGFMVSMATNIFGRASRNYEDEKIIKNYGEIIKGIDYFINKQLVEQKENLNSYWDFDSLKEFIGQCDKKELAEYYKKAFNVLIEEDFNVENMEICWNH